MLTGVNNINSVIFKCWQIWAGMTGKYFMEVVELRASFDVVGDESKNI